MSSTKPHYFKIGLFVILATLLVVVAVVIFGAGLLARDRLYFETYFEESITGLTSGSLVMFRGVRIGEVRQIGFVGHAYDLDQYPDQVSTYKPYVRVVGSVVRGNLPELGDEDAGAVLDQMIERGLRVRVTSNILTGEAYLEIDYLAPNRFEVLRVPWEPHHMYLPSARGELTTIKDSIDKILHQLQEIDLAHLVATLEQVLRSIEGAVADANLANMTREVTDLLRETRRKVAALDTERINELTETLLVSLHQTVADANVPALSQEAQSLLAEARQTLRALEVERISRGAQDLLALLDRTVTEADVPALSRETRDLIAQLHIDARHLETLLAGPGDQEFSVSIPQVLQRLDTSLSRIDQLIVGERPEIEIILRNFREISDSLRDLAESLRDRPSDLFFGRPPARSEVLK